MNRVALVTGGSRGIGRGICLELAASGWSIVINYCSNHAAAEETAAECAKAGNGKFLSCRGDIASAADRTQVIEFTRQEFGRLDLLVNNAGVAPSARADLLDTSEESFDRLISINAKGPFFLSQAVARWMIADGIRGKIVTISSISAYTASINRGEYCVSKAALSMLTPLFATRLAEHGINVYEIRPGIIATDMTGPVKAKYDALIDNGLTPIKRWGTPADIGKAVRAIADDLLPFSTGEVINVDGGFHMRWL